MTAVATATDPEGRVVVISEAAWGHVLAEHDDMAGHLASVVATIERPDFIEPDARPGRERYFRRGLGPARWLRVVVAFDLEPPELVTAFGHVTEP